MFKISKVFHLFSILNLSIPVTAFRPLSINSKSILKMKSDLDVSIDEVSAAFLGVDADQLWFGDDFQRAWSNVVKSVKTDKRKLYLVTDFDHTLTTFDSKQCHDIVALHDEYPKEFHADFLEICAMAFSDSNFHK
jgi:hypothetical protein